MPNRRRRAAGVRPCLLALAWLLTAPSLAAGMTSDPACRLPPGIVTSRPEAQGPATPVRVGLFVLDVTSIDELTESFTVDLLMIVRWQDPRLSRASLGASLEGCIFQLEDVWHPRIGIVNQRIVTSRGDETLRVDAEGNVEFRVGFYGELSSPLDLHRFPFDSQRLGISISTDYGSDVELVGDAATTGILPEAGIAGWRILRVDEAPIARTIEAAGATYGVTEFALWIAREPAYYVWKIFLPLTFIIGMASIVFWLDPRDFGPQIGVSTASVFTLIAFLLSLGRFLPRVSYLTTADLFVLGALTLVFGALAECVLSSRLAQSGRYELACRVDAVARWVYPVGFLAVAFGVLIAS